MKIFEMRILTIHDFILSNLKEIIADFFGRIGCNSLWPWLTQSIINHDYNIIKECTLSSFAILV